MAKTINPNLEMLKTFDAKMSKAEAGYKRLYDALAAGSATEMSRVLDDGIILFTSEEAHAGSRESLAELIAASEAKNETHAILSFERDYQVTLADIRGMLFMEHIYDMQHRLALALMVTLSVGNTCMAVTGGNHRMVMEAVEATLSKLQVGVQLYLAVARK